MLRRADSEAIVVNPSIVSDFRRLRREKVPSVKRRASNILNEYGAVQSELIGKAVVLTDGKAGTVENVWLD
jgi:hypothetical protein